MNTGDSLDTNQSKYPPLSGVGLVLLITVLVFLASSVFGNLTLGKWPLLIGELTLLLPAFLYLRRYKYDYRRVFRLNPVSGRVVSLTVLLGFAIAVLTMELDRLVNFVLPFPEQWETALNEALRADSFQDWVIILLAAVVFAGLFEEMLFRGFVQNTFEQRHQPLAAIFITAVLFGAIHLNPWWFVQFIFIAMFLGLLAWKSDSVVPSVVVHAQNNLIAVLMSNIADDPNSVLERWSGWKHVLLLMVTAVTLYYGFKLFFRFCEEDTEIPTLLNTPGY